MGRGRHKAAFHHVFAGSQAEFGHGEIFRAELFALAAQGAAVDHGVGRVQALDNGGVVVRLPGVDPRIPFVFLQVDALFDADEALALQAARGFLRGFFRGVGEARWFPAGIGRNACDIRVQGALRFFPCGGEGNAAHQAIQGLRRPAALSGLGCR